MASPHQNQRNLVIIVISTKSVANAMAILYLPLVLCAVSPFLPMRRYAKLLNRFIDDVRVHATFFAVQEAQLRQASTNSASACSRFLTNFLPNLPFSWVYAVLTVCVSSVQCIFKHLIVDGSPGWDRIRDLELAGATYFSLSLGAYISHFLQYMSTM